MENAYSPPRAEVAPTAATTDAPLYSPGQIGAAAFFATIGASAWMARSNLVALGQRERGNTVLVVGILITAGLLGLAFVLPDGVPGLVYTIPQIAIAVNLAKKEFEPHMEGRERRSNWRVVGVCVATAAVLFGGLIAVALAFEE
jgi:hypothetical protein